MDKDDRFKHISTDPKFRRIPKGERKVKIDKRFRSMFEDEKFKVKYTIDKRGRPVNHTSTEDLKRYYDLSSESDKSESSEDEDLNESGKYVRAPKSENSQLIEKNKNDGVIPEQIKKKLKNLSVDYARGEGVLVSESSSDDESELEESDEDEMDHGWGELDRDAESTENATRRLAICNMDWDKIRAVDLMVLFNSFLSPGGIIHSVTIYPSEFGIQRMNEEEVKGPMELVDEKNREKFKDTETEEGSKYHMEKLRQYQLNRLKYFYAVMVLDSAETASKIYSECDGLEYESSATIIDLRFIPDGTTFDQEPKEICDKIPELMRYQPRFFTTTALQQAKVELTWDETNPERTEIAKKLSDGKIDDVCEADLQTYLASSSGDDTESDEGTDENEETSDKNPIDKYRALLQGLEITKEEKSKKDIEMEVTWGLNVKQKSEKLVKKKLSESTEKTPFQQYVEKRKEKRKAKREERIKKRELNAANSDENHSNNEDDIPSDIDMNDPYFAEEFNKPEFQKKKTKNKEVKHKESDDESKQQKAELELLLLNENEDEKRHFSFKKIQEEENDKKSKKKRKKNKGKPSKEDVIKGQEDFEVNVKDDRFSAIFSSHHFNIDPTDPRYRKTKAMEALIEEKQKRRLENDNSVINKKPKLQNKHSELSVLVKSIKRNTKAIDARK